MYTTLISPADLHQKMAHPDWIIVDCRFDLNNTHAGRAAYQTAHIPGAVYAHLDDDLSGPIISGQTGRHPFPTLESFTETLSNWSITDGVQVVAYDAKGGAIASRLWGMLRWLGHEPVAVLDGGWPAWERAGYPIETDIPISTRRPFHPKPDPAFLVDEAEILAALETNTHLLIDARATPRYRGEHEPLDPVAGHIPGAVSAPFGGNLDESGNFLSPSALRERFVSLIGERAPENIVCYCGSGVTANHNLLAMVHAGWPLPRLYAGSWSAWITDPARSIATGD